MLGSVLGAFWWVVTSPFRLVMWVVEMVGRLAALALGFMLMVVGVALWAGPLPLVGVPVFVVGLVLTIRSLE